MEGTIPILLTRRRYILTELEVAADSAYLLFEIRLPSQMKKLDNVVVTNTCPNISGSANKLGTIAFLSNDETDLFLCMDIFDDAIALTDNSLCGLSPIAMETDEPWTSGKAPRAIPITVSSQTGIITGWYKVTNTPVPYTLKIVLRYEEKEQQISTEETLL
ncbi:MAG: hypothetical protein M3Q97_07220 [Bacteroidota bacterium]|nr:hypothetical protein [Bacteroidota bacterium]